MMKNRNIFGCCLMTSDKPWAEGGEEHGGERKRLRSRPGGTPSLTRPNK